MNDDTKPAPPPPATPSDQLPHVSDQEAFGHLHKRCTGKMGDGSQCRSNTTRASMKVSPTEKRIVDFCVIHGKIYEALVEIVEPLTVSVEIDAKDSPVERVVNSLQGGPE